MNSQQHLVLHGLAIKKYAGAAAVAGIAGLDPELTERLLNEAVARGKAVRAKDGYTLAPLARTALDGEYSRVYAEERCNPALSEAYRRFETVDRQVKTLMTDWQTVEIGGRRLPNDHSDASYDREIVDKLGALQERADGVLARFAAAIPRLDVYRAKLVSALERAENGDLDYVSGARVDSFHTVWFELHEDLLRILGRTREE